MKRLAKIKLATTITKICQVKTDAFVVAILPTILLIIWERKLLETCDFECPHFSRITFNEMRLQCFGCVLGGKGCRVEFGGGSKWGSIEYPNYELFKNFRGKLVAKSKLACVKNI